jgi:hypothetical protein
MLGAVAILAPFIGLLMHYGYPLQFDGKSWRLKKAATARLAKALANH